MPLNSSRGNASQKERIEGYVHQDLMLNRWMYNLWWLLSNLRAIVDLLWIPTKSISKEHCGMYPKHSKRAMFRKEKINN